MNPLLRRLGIELPIVQAPMAGMSTPEMAAAVSNAGRLGSIGVGAADPEYARGMIRAVRALTDRPFNVNVFCHTPAGPDPVREAAWVNRLAPSSPGTARPRRRPCGRSTRASWRTPQRRPCSWPRSRRSSASTSAYLLPT